VSCAERVLGDMSQGQRIGQLFLMGLAGNRLGPTELSAIRGLHVGSVWFPLTTSAGVAGLRAVSDAVQAEAGTAATAGVGFFIAANQEGGHVQHLNGPGFSVIPTALVQGTRSPEVLRGEARVWGQELLSAGVNLNFAPVFDVVPVGAEVTNRPIGAFHREYGHDPVTAGTGAAAFVAGMTEAGVATTAKHFPGLGRVIGNTDYTSGVVDTVTGLADPFLDSFRTAIGAEVPFVMVSLATYTQIDPTNLAAFSPIVIGQLLRRDLGFQGVVMSDDLAHTAAVQAIDPGQRAVAFLLAGGDLVVSRSVPDTVAMVAAVEARASSDTSFVTRLDEAALRVLEAKEAAGLLPC
jgi:beta-N-acetylhexosaminidase